MFGKKDGYAIGSALSARLTTASSATLRSQSTAIMPYGGGIVYGKVPGEFVAFAGRPRGKMGIITQRRQPPPVVQPRKPMMLPRELAMPRPGHDFNWQQLQKLEQRKWDQRTGAVIRNSEALAAGEIPIGDAINDMVNLQRERRERNKGIGSAPPVVQRLLKPPAPVAPPKDALDLFAEHMAANPPPLAGGETKAFARDDALAGRYQGKRNVAAELGMRTKMGLNYARRTPYGDPAPQKL